MWKINDLIRGSILSLSLSSHNLKQTIHEIFFFLWNSLCLMRKMGTHKKKESCYLPCIIEISVTYCLNSQRHLHKHFSAFKGFLCNAKIKRNWNWNYFFLFSVHFTDVRRLISALFLELCMWKRKNQSNWCFNVEKIFFQLIFDWMSR